MGPWTGGTVWWLFTAGLSADAASLEEALALDSQSPLRSQVSADGYRPEWESGVLVGPLAVGDRVRRGPDWRWRDQDGGAGGLGTVVAAGIATGWVRVLWDAGGANTYRWNVDNAFDLERQRPTDRALATPSSSGASVVAALAALPPSSSAEQWSAVAGPVLLSAYDRDGSGLLDHDSELAAIPCATYRALEGGFIRSADGPRNLREALRSAAPPPEAVAVDSLLLDQLDTTWARCLAVPVERTPETLGPLPAGARVARGPDWKWDDQDGGADVVGTVIRGAKKADWARVRWGEGEVNTYRWGHEDAVDLVQLIPGRPLAEAVRELRHTPGSEPWRQVVRPLLVDALDQDRTGFIDHPTEVDAIPCALLQALQAQADDHRTLRPEAAVTLPPDALALLDESVGFAAEVGSELQARRSQCIPLSADGVASAALPAGTRVLRGPDWKWKDQDGGPGRPGTIERAPTEAEWARVLWDAGQRDSYRWGHDNARDLVLATAGASSAEATRSIRSVAWSGDPLGAWQTVRPVVLQVADLDGSGQVDTLADLDALSCDVLRAIEDRYIQGGRFVGPLRIVYGFVDLTGTRRAEHPFPGEALGFAASIRTEADHRFRMCGVR
jgi:hypothetical protein